MQYKVVIGAEIHTQLKTKTKAFCRCENSYGGIPNTKVCPVCLGLPGALPIMNLEHVKKSILVGHAFNCKIRDILNYDRKHYMYPDLAKGYQITQFREPIIYDGYIDFEVNNSLKRVKINEAHMEEDTAKNLHIGETNSYLDYNRAGAPLLEIVSAPDLESGEELVAYLQAIREVLVYLDISDCNMEEGAFRCDVNINLHITEGDKVFSTPISEIKNLNSFRYIRNSVEFEINNQLEDWKKNRRELKDFGKETRGYDDAKSETFLLRSKEGAIDYRYLPEYDLPTTRIEPSIIADIKKQLKELPLNIRERFKKDYALSDFDVITLTSDKNLVEYFESSVKSAISPKKFANWILTETLSILNNKSISILDFPIKSAYIKDLSNMIEEGDISGAQAKKIFEIMLENPKDPKILAKENGFSKQLDNKDLDDIIKKVIAANEKSVNDYKSGKETAIKFLLGQVLKASGGAGNPDTILEHIKKLI